MSLTGSYLSGDVDARPRDTDPGDPGPSDPPRRVLYVEANEDRTVGGSHRILYDLVRRIDRGRYEPVVLFYQPNVYRRRLENEGIEVVVFDEERSRERRLREEGPASAKYLDFAGAIVRRARLIRRLRVELVHLNNSPAVGFDDWLPACRALGVPCITNAMGLVPGDAGGLQRWLMQGYARVLASSTSVAASLRSVGLDTSVQVVPLAVDVEGFRRRAAAAAGGVRAELGVPENELLALMVGHVRPWKGQHLVLEGVAALPDRLRERLTLVLVGDVSDHDAEYGERVLRRAGRADLEGRVRYLGPRDDVPRLMEAADVAVHASSEPEPFGLVIVEAMAVGTPVIAADRGGPVDILEGEEGELVDPARPEDLAGALVRLLEDPAHRERMSRAARQRAEAFDISRYVERLERVYSEVLRSRV